MTGFRRGLQRWAVAGLLLQAAAFGALVPRDCCRAHTHDRKEAAKPSCHTTAEKTDDRCALRGTCDGPMTGMVALLSQLGVMPAPTAAPVDTGDTALVLAFVLEPDRLATPPDSPPPRG